MNEVLNPELEEACRETIPEIELREQVPERDPAEEGAELSPSPKNEEGEKSGTASGLDLVLERHGGAEEDWKITYHESGHRFDPEARELLDEHGKSLTKEIETSDDNMSAEKIAEHYRMLDHFQSNPDKPYLLPDWVEQTQHGEVIHSTIVTLDENNIFHYETRSHEVMADEPEEEDAREEVQEAPEAGILSDEIPASDDAAETVASIPVLRIDLNEKILGSLSAEQAYSATAETAPIEEDILPALHENPHYETAPHEVLATIGKDDGTSEDAGPETMEQSSVAAEATFMEIAPAEAVGAEAAPETAEGGAITQADGAAAQEISPIPETSAEMPVAEAEEDGQIHRLPETVMAPRETSESMPADGTAEAETLSEAVLEPASREKEGSEAETTVGSAAAGENTPRAETGAETRTEAEIEMYPAVHTAETREAVQVMKSSAEKAGATNESEVESAEAQAIAHKTAARAGESHPPLQENADIAKSAESSTDRPAVKEKNAPIEAVSHEDAPDSAGHEMTGPEENAWTREVIAAPQEKTLPREAIAIAQKPEAAQQESAVTVEASSTAPAVEARVIAAGTATERAAYPEHESAALPESSAEKDSDIAIEASAEASNRTETAAAEGMTGREVLLRSLGIVTERRSAGAGAEAKTGAAETLAPFTVTAARAGAAAGAQTAGANQSAGSRQREQELKPRERASGTSLNGITLRRAA